MLSSLSRAVFEIQMAFPNPRRVGTDSGILDMRAVVQNFVFTQHGEKRIERPAYEVFQSG